MRIFKDVKLVEQLGSGIKRILRSYDKEIFLFFPNFLKASFPIKDAGKDAGKKSDFQTETQKSIIDLIQEKPYISQQEIGRILTKHVSTIERNMKKMQEQKLIKRVGSKTEGYWQIIEQNKD